MSLTGSQLGSTLGQVLTVFLVGPPAYLYDESKELTVRVHDECKLILYLARGIILILILTQGNGSDVFGSDICTCKPYLIYAIEECVRCAQRGGVGLVVYFRKEGRALGEVTKSVSSLRFSTIDSDANRS